MKAYIITDLEINDLYHQLMDIEQYKNLMEDSSDICRRINYVFSNWLSEHTPSGIKR
jgi:hypothetical protein